MPTVPGQRSAPQQMAGLRPSDEFLMMAAATMHEQGRLTFQDRAQPVEDAIADGTFDPVGAGYTDFKRKR